MNKKGQAISEYMMMLAVVLGLVIGAGLLFNDKVVTFFTVVKQRLKESIVGGAFSSQQMRQNREASGTEEEPYPSKIPQYPINYPQRRQTGTSEQKE